MPYLAAGRALALAALVAAVPAAAQAIYKWVDEKGVTHFSESPPSDARMEKKATKVTPRVTPPSVPGAYDPNAWKGKEVEARKRGVERGEQARADAKDAAQRAEACERARKQLEALEATLPLFRTNPDGTRTYMDDSTREAEKARARAVAEQACR
jgi:hypothetical protein